MHRVAFRPQKGPVTGLRVTPELVVRELRAQNFAVLSTVNESGGPDSAGVNYGVAATDRPLTLYVMTRRHLRKAMNIASNPAVSLVMAVPRKILRFVPPATIQLHGTAEILDATDQEGTEVFRRSLIGRLILSAHAASHRRGETRDCFLRIAIAPEVHTYAVGYSAWELRRDIERGVGFVRMWSDES